MSQTDSRWWSMLNALVRSKRIVVDRPAGTAHPRYPDAIYPLDYGYVENTNGGDGSGIDVWIGASESHELRAAICCVDRLKGEIETKLLLGCTDAEIEVIRRFHSEGDQAALVLRPPGSL